MPFKSEAQRKALNAKADRGEVSQEMVDEMNEKSKGKKLPAKAPVPKKPKPAKKQPKSLAEMRAANEAKKKQMSEGY